MSALKWDQTGEKFYETGDKKMVLYVSDVANPGQYLTGVAWNGITAVSSNDSGAEETALWADDIKYAVLRSAPEYGGTIEAYQCPIEFYQCDGAAVVGDGVVIGQQGRKTFGISYVTTIGNDVLGTDYGYKIHIVWACSASPSERSYQTINDSPDAMTLSWEFTTTPVPIGSITIDGTATEFKPVSHIVIDASKYITNGEKDSKLVTLEEKLYGRDADATNNTTASDPTLPTPAQVIKLMLGIND